MIKYIITLFMISSFYSLYSQTEDTIQEVLSIEDELIWIAWKNNFIDKAYENELDITHAELRQAKTNWLSNLAIGGNMNELSIDPPENSNIFFPRYNIGFSLSFGQLIGMKAEVKKVNGKLIRLDIERTQDSLKFRSDVLRRYEVFKMTRELLQIAEEYVISIDAELKFTESGFSEGRVDLATYTQVIEIHSSARSALIKSRNEHVLSKISLEEILGQELRTIGLSGSW